MNCDTYAHVSDALLSEEFVSSIVVVKYVEYLDR